ncbi:hypothetical protein [Nostoc sp. UHCC 0870]|uniref:hypothetical protein n=1 Tax=Nostoc sp. UHCC 0870 TaxID=2914041 RepID=UPI001EDFCDB5|nr:hypothetical protein [Nostoc sp. UHCC 0870]UKO97778.1 hypothetical protein L6494_24975 [Nostoc sp. UHCC 0870]
MHTNWLNQIGDWNPQLLREIKGRLYKRNVLLAITTSLLSQLGVFIYFQTLLPNKDHILYPRPNRYCTDKYVDIANQCFLDNSGNININWQLWFQDIFTSLSIIGFFAILVAGSYLLINDLSAEERRDTLNFIRLSPQSPQSILFGKMLGVPILVYLGICTAIPVHLWLGLNAEISLSFIFSFYLIVITTSLFYFSGALLFSLVGSWLGGFQAWLGSSAVLGFLLLTQQGFRDARLFDYPFAVLTLINPYYFIRYQDLANFQWFALPLGNSWVIIMGFAVLIHLLGSYFFWQSLQRCFRDRNTTMLSKQQSYLLTTAFTMITIGCANWPKLVFGKYDYSSAFTENIASLLFLNLFLFLYLIAALTPHRHNLQDWARYRHMASQQGGKGQLMQDLIWGKKSPGVVAIAINAIIAISGLSLFTLISLSSATDKFYTLIALIFAGTLAAIYAALTQLLLLMKNGQRLFWTNGVLGAVIILPVVTLAILFSRIQNQTFLWLFSVAAPIIALSPSRDLSAMTAFLAIMGHTGILGLLLFQMTRQLKKVGESETKILLTGSQD